VVDSRIQQLDFLNQTIDYFKVTNLQPLLERNRAFAATGTHTGLAMMPRQPVFVVTCLDPRVDPAAFLGVELGDAPVIRNAGGRVTEAVLDDLAFIGHVSGLVRPDGPLFEVAVVHHTGCGTALLADPGFRAGFAAHTELDEATLAGRAVLDPAATVRADVSRLLASPKAPARTSASGHVYDVDTGLVTTVVEPTPVTRCAPSPGR
jgi:carbonic anhydrase